MDGLENRWDEDTLESFNPYREIFREASSDVVRKVFGQYVGAQDKIIEIGSGLGELVKLVPEYEGRIQQTEQSPMIAQGNKRLNPRSNVRVADVYDLQFPDESFEVATGYSSFDTLSNLCEALTEVRRVLMPGGRFIHFLDIYASGNAIFHRYAPKNVTPFPLFELDKENNMAYGTGVQLVKMKDLKKVRAAFTSANPGLREIFDAYVEDPELMFTTGFNHPEYRKILHMYSHLVEKSGVRASPLRFNDDFKENLERSLDECGYRILESGKREGVAIVRRNGRHRQKPHINLFYNDVGGDRSRFEPKVISELGFNRVKVISNLYVTAAQKA